MLETNSGLQSRFTHQIEFPDWVASDCVDLVQKRAKRDKYEVGPSVVAALQAGFSELVKLPGWGNARDVDAVWKGALRERADRAVLLPEGSPKSIFEDDVRRAMDAKLKSRLAVQERGSRQDDVAKDCEPLVAAAVTASLCALPLPPPPPPLLPPPTERATPLTTKAEITAEHLSCCPLQGVDNRGPMVEEETERRDPDVSDSVWAELTLAKERERVREAHQRAELVRIEEERLKAEASYAAEQERLRLIKEERAREEELRRARLAYEAKLRARQEAEQKILKEKRMKQAIQEKLRQLSPCPAGFQWTQTSGGWRCGGGSHFVSDAELQKNFTH